MALYKYGAVESLEDKLDEIIPHSEEQFIKRRKVLCDIIFPYYDLMQQIEDTKRRNEMNIQKLKQQLFMYLTLATTASYLWLCFGGPRELVYMQVPLAGLLSQIGGTWNKLFRRIAIPTLFTVSAIGFLGFHWQLLLLWPAYFGVATLPFTLKGESLYDYWFNWVWVVILGCLAWASAIFIPYYDATLYGGYLWLLIWTIVGYSIPGILSNIPATRKFFEWKLCEALFWSSIAIVVSCLVSWAR